MRTWLLLIGMGLSGFGLGACTPTVSDSAACKALGMYGSKDECQAVNSGVSCEMATLTSQSTSKTVLCWKPSAGGQNTNPFPTPTTTPSCNGAPPDWTLGAWSPDKCSPGVTQQTRSVTCTAPCPCASPAPSTTQACSGDLYNGNHYTQQCLDAGGKAGPDGLYFLKKACSFAMASCPAGWSALLGSNGQPVTWTACNTSAYCKHHNYPSSDPSMEPGTHIIKVYCY